MAQQLGRVGRVPRAHLVRVRVRVGLGLGPNPNPNPTLPLSPCRQRICASENWGFTKLRRDQYTALKGLGQLIKNGVDVKVAKVKGPLGPNELQKLPMSMLGGDEE